MGLYANLPLALSCGMGTNFMLGAMVQTGAVSFGWVMALLLCSGVIFILITVCGVRKVVVEMLPKKLQLDKYWASVSPSALQRDSKKMGMMVDTSRIKAELPMS
jgi:hypothetical protein